MTFNKKIFSLSQLAVILVLITSCHVKNSVVSKQPPEPIELKTYKLSNVSQFDDNKVFLWKKEEVMTPDQVTNLQNISQLIDGIFADSTKLEQTQKDLQIQYDNEVKSIDPIKKQRWEVDIPNEVDDNNKLIGQEKSKINNFTKKLDKASDKKKLNQTNYDDLNNKLSEENKKENPDQTIVLDLKNQMDQIKQSIDSAQLEIDKQNLNIHNSNESINTLEAKIDSLNNEKNELEKTLFEKASSLKQKITDLDLEKNKLTERLQSAGKELEINVDAMENPSFLRVKSENGNLKSLEVFWKHDYKEKTCTNCIEDFVTDNNSIKDISYQEIGGILQFTLIDSISKEEFLFKLNRINSDDPNAKIAFQGSIQINSPDGSKRYGIAKFLTK